MSRWGESRQLSSHRFGWRLAARESVPFPSQMIRHYWWHLVPPEGEGTLARCAFSAHSPGSIRCRAGGPSSHLATSPQAASRAKPKLNPSRRIRTAAGGLRRKRTGQNTPYTCGAGKRRTGSFHVLIPLEQTSASRFVLGALWRQAPFPLSSSQSCPLVFRMTQSRPPVSEAAFLRGF